MRRRSARAVESVSRGLPIRRPAKNFKMRILLLSLCAAATLASAMVVDDTKILLPAKDAIVNDSAKKIDIPSTPIDISSTPIDKVDMITKTVQPDIAVRKLGASFNLLATKQVTKDAEMQANLLSLPWKKRIEENKVTLTHLVEKLNQNEGGFIKPEILKDYNLTAEYDYWMNNDVPTYLQFGDEDMVHTTTLGGPLQPLGVSLTEPLDVVYRKAVHFHYFNKDDETDMDGFDFRQAGVLKDHAKDWDASLPLKVIIHGFINSVRSPIIQMIKNAFLKTGKYNVIAVDWSRLNRPQYDVAVFNVFGTAARVGLILDDLIKAKMVEPDNLHIIGHSLGAHVAGISAKSMKLAKPGRVTGLDPAGPLFWLAGPNSKIYRTDAKLVDIIHTNAGYLGKSEALGHVDFHPNGGRWQQGCGPDYFGTCAHSRSYELFAQSILNNKGFLAFSCNDLPNSDSRACLARMADNSQLHSAYMGYPVSFEQPGSYYTFTNFEE